MSKLVHIGGALGALAEYAFTEAQNQQFLAEKRRAKERAEVEDFGFLKTMALKAFAGERGEQLRVVAEEWSRFHCIRSDQIAGLKMTHKPALEELRDALRKAKDRT